MSRYMQIRIHLEPVYHPELRAHFPKLASVLEGLGIPVDPLRTTLYDLALVLERGLYGEIRPALKAALKRHLPVLRDLRGQVEKKLASWQREGLDDLLYRIEDVFEELEKDLD